VGTELFSGLEEHSIHNGLILWHPGGCGEKRGIGRGVLGFEFLDRFKIPAVGDDYRHFFKLFKQCLGHAISLLAYTFSVRLLTVEILKIAIGFMGPQNWPLLR
jgi:hypothetical protein